MKKRSDCVHCPTHLSSLYPQCLYKISKLLFALDVILSATVVVVTTPDRRPLAYDVAEELPPGAVVVADMARDAGLSSRYPAEVLRLISYSIIGQQQSQAAEYFRLNDHGQLVTVKTINREAICRQLWQCVVHLDVAIHPAKYFEIVKLELNVTDINDNPPVFTPNRLALSLLESTQPKELVSIIPAVDLDSPPNGVVRYALQPSSERFAIKVRNRTPAGEADLRLVLLQPLDREKQDRFQMQVLAVDGGSPPLTGTLSVDVSVIDVNDNSPQFENASYSAEILENHPSGSTVVRVQARDPDSGLNGHVRYQFSRRSQVVSGDVFSIDSVSGAVVLLKPAKDLAQSVYSLAVIAEDQGENSVPSMTSVTVTVHDVNEHRPVIFVDTHAGDGHQGAGWKGGDRTRTRARGGEDEAEEEVDVVGVEVAEHGSPNASVVTVSVTDDDRGINGRVSCSLDGDGAFAIVQLFESEYKIVTTRSLDYRAQRQHRLSIRCRDFGQPVPLSAVRNLTVTVTDASLDAPVFPVASYNASIRENNAPNEAILSVSANVRSKKNRTRIHYSLDHDARGRRSPREHQGILFL